MRTALMMAASLLALSACEGRQTADQPMASETGAADMAGAADGTLGDQPPAAQGFAREVALTDMYEVNAGRLALDKSKDARVREFAQMMIDDHTRSSQALQEAAITGNSTPGGNTTGTGEYSMPANLDQERQSQLDILQRLDGADFDREYLNQQAAGHRKTLDLLKAYAATGDVDELRQFAQGAIPTIQKHYDWLEQNAPGAMATGAVPAR